MIFVNRDREGVQKTSSFVTIRHVNTPEEKLIDLYLHGEEIPSFLHDFMNAEEMVRLKDAGMNCGLQYTSFPLFKDIPSYSRYIHSLGVACILWHFTKDRAVTISGLLHDLSTPVFSHVVDFMHKDYMKQESTEEPTKRMILESVEIMHALNYLRIDVSSVWDYHMYPLADNDLPHLSADRLEYTLGNALRYGFFTLDEIKLIYDDLTAGEEELVFTSFEKGKLFTEAALKCAMVYSCDEDRYAMERLSLLLTKALNMRIISEEEITMGTERQVIDALLHSELQGEWESFTALRKVSHVLPVPSGRMVVHIDAKRRIIDPYVKDQGRVSELDSDLNERMEAYRNTSYDYDVYEEV